MRAVLVAASAALLLSIGAPPDPPRVYSTDAADPWNRIFSLLFTRTVNVLKTEEFADAGPFTGPPPFPASTLRLRVSTRTFDSYEDGDRAIEPLYPSFITQRGTNYILDDSRRAQLAQALTDALAERVTRAPLDRALMQADLWSAFDALDAIANAGHETPRRREGARSLAAPIARLIGKLALTDGEIARLPDNYAAARRTAALPDLFASDSGWMEVVMSPHRMHDQAADMRRASRVFVKAARRDIGEAVFLEALHAGRTSDVAVTALVMQTLLVDSKGRAVPARLISDVQIRTPSGIEGKPGDVEEFELSRRMLRANPSAGGFRRFSITSPAYVPIAGNDYGFATPDRDRSGETAPVLGTLGTRCGTCHGPSGMAFMTFNLVHAPEAPLPPVRHLRVPNDDRARRVAAEKEGRPDFVRLVAAALRK